MKANDRKVCLTLAILMTCALPIAAEELTLKDFQPDVRQPDRVDSWREHGVPPDQWLKLVVAAEDCQLRIPFDDQVLIAETVTFTRNAAAPRLTYLLLGGNDRAVPSELDLIAAFDLTIQTKGWQDFWRARSKLQRELACRDLVALLP